MEFVVVLASLVDRLDPAVGVFLEHFRDDRVPLRLSAAIAAAAAILLTVLVVWGVIARIRIFRLRRTVRASTSAAAFSSDFARVDAAFAGSIFASAWGEYRDSLKHADGRVFYARRPHEYLALSTLESGGFPTRFFAAAHGYFIGVGLLLTFVGLVAALKFAAVGVASPEIAVAKQALNALLSAASFKFMTSIAGLGCSLLLSVAARTMICAVEGAACGLAGSLERRMAPLIAENLAFDQLAAIQAQSAALEQLSRDLSLGTTPAAATILPPTLVAMPVAMPAIDNAADADRFAHLLDAALSELRGSAGAEMRQLTARLGEIGDALGRMQNHIGHSGDAFADQLGLAASRLLDAATALQSGVDGRIGQVGEQIDALARTVAHGETAFGEAGQLAAQGMAQATGNLVAMADRLAQRLDGAVRGFDQVNLGLQAPLASLREIIASLDGARHGLDGSAGIWLQAAAPVVASVDASRQVTGDLARVADRMAAAQRDMATMAGAMAQLSETTSSVWEDYRLRFAQVDDDLRAVFAQLHGGTRAFGSEVMEFVGKLDSSLSGGMQALSIGTEELREVAELLVAGTQAKAA